MAYYRLLEAFKTKGCPVCLLTENSIHRYMQSLLYESVNNPGVRRKLREGGGFCNNHAWSLKDMGDALGQSLIYEDLLQNTLNIIKKVDKNTLSLKSNTGYEKKCIICELRETTENRLIYTIIRSSINSTLNHLVCVYPTYLKQLRIIPAIK